MDFSKPIAEAGNNNFLPRNDQISNIHPSMQAKSIKYVPYEMSDY